MSRLVMGLLRKQMLLLEYCSHPQIMLLADNLLVERLLSSAENVAWNVLLTQRLLLSAAVGRQLLPAPPRHSVLGIHSYHSASLESSCI